MRVFILLSILIQCVLACSEKPAAAFDVQRPNVIIIMTDDQGWGDLSLHGNSNLNTPHIDSLATGGTQFTNFYVQPVCSPSRAELLTGRHFRRLGVYSTSAGGERINQDETTIAQIFKSNGYHTGLFGKWHSGTQPPYHPLSRGFDEFYGFTSGHWGNYFNPILEHNFELVQAEGYLADDLTKKAIHFIHKHKNEPFFIFLSYNTPHSPMQVPERNWDPINSETLVMKHHGIKEDTTFTKAALSMVENIDFNVGELHEALRSLGLGEDTIVIFLSDNGPNNWRWNGDMKGRKGSTDEGGVRSPFFIHWPKKIKATKLDQIASTIDILPTLTSLTGINMKTAKPVDGIDLSPLLLEENPDWKPRIVYNYWNGKISVRSQQFRLDHEDRLFEIELDRGQTMDVADKYPKIRDSLAALRMDWLANTEPVNAHLTRPFTLGQTGYRKTWLPARDGHPYGNIERSNRYPNCSFFTNWNKATDSIVWSIEVIETGNYDVTMHFTANQYAIGKRLQLGFGPNTLTKIITEAHDPPLRGMENDRIPRIESYVKEFIPLDLGTIHLTTGRGRLVLTSPDIYGNENIDVRMLEFRKRD